MSQEKPKHPEITLKPVKSSQISKVGYDKASNTLAIQFKSGGTYHYANVSQQDFDGLNHAESIGSHFYKHIKPNKDKYPYTKLP